MPPELRAAAEPPRHTSQWQRPRRSALFTWLLAIVAPSAAFLTLAAPGLATAGVQVIPLVAALLVVLSSVLMALTSFTNPGTIAPSSSHLNPDELPAHMIVNGAKLPLKFCRVCGVVRPPRTSHCRETDRCIEKWDHYCPWVGTAVGRRNYRFFVSFVISTVCLAACVATGSLLHLWILAASFQSASGASPPPPAPSPPGPLIATVTAAASPGLLSWPVWLRAVGVAPASCILFLYCSVVTMLLGLLVCYHLYLIAVNQTTYENVKGAFNGSHGSNPFNRGCLANFGEVFCPSCFPPLSWEADVEGVAPGRATQLQAAMSSRDEPRTRTSRERDAIELSADWRQSAGTQDGAAKEV